MDYRSGSGQSSMRRWRRLKEDQAMRRATVIVNAVALCLVALVAGMSTISAQEGTTGKVTLESKSVAIGVGVSWGDGVLEYRGKKYPFSVEGLSVVDLDVSKVSAQGDVKN